MGVRSHRRDGRFPPEPSWIALTKTSKSTPAFTPAVITSMRRHTDDGTEQLIHLFADRASADAAAVLDFVAHRVESGFDGVVGVSVTADVYGEVAFLRADYATTDRGV